MRLLWLVLVFGMLVLTGCGSYPTVPDLGLATPQDDPNTPWPKLRPTQELLNRGAIDTRSAVQGIDRLEARAAAMRTRARSLQGPLIDAPTRARMLRLMRSR